MAACDLDTLQSDACSNGFENLSTHKLLVVIAQLLCNGGGGGGGGGGGETGVVDPEGVVTASPGTTYYNSANQTFWVKASGVGNTGWVQIV